MRKLIRNLLRKIGYDIVKVNVHSDDKVNRIKKVTVGNFVLEMPGNNPQISTYKYDPEANSQLGRLAACIAQKYPDLSVLDIGANVGDTIAVTKTAIDIPIIGIEGDAVSFRFLEQNVKQFNEVVVLKEFLGEKKQTVQVAFEKKGWNTTLIPTSSSGETILLKTLDEVLEENLLSERNIKVFKVDCEGFDTIIIRGAGSLLKEKKPVIFFEYNKTNMTAIGEDGLSTLFALEKFGYTNAIFFDAYGRFILNIPLKQRTQIQQLHHYAEEGISPIAYYDICLFHNEDADIEAKFIDAISSH